MALAESFAALLVTGIENGTVGEDDARTEQHVVTVGMHATVHA